MNSLQQKTLKPNLQVYGEVLDTTRLIAVLLEHGSLDKKAVSQTNNNPLEIYQCLIN